MRFENDILILDQPAEIVVVAAGLTYLDSTTHRRNPLNPLDERIKRDATYVEEDAWSGYLVRRTNRNPEFVVKDFEYDLVRKSCQEVLSREKQKKLRKTQTQKTALGILEMLDIIDS